MMALDSVQVRSEPYFSFLKSFFHAENFSVIALAGDASSRRYFRVVHDDQSLVLMVWEPFEDDGKYPFLSVLTHFARSQVHVPKVYAKSPDEGYVLLEDLGDLTLERKFWENQNQENAMSFYRQAMDELVKIHHKVSANRQNDCTAFHISFDVEKLLWEMNYARTHLLEKFCQFRLSTTESSTLDRAFHDICERLHREPKFVAHRDYHSRNLMLKLGKMRVIDFQDARMGPVQYDLVSLLRDSYVDLREDLAQGLIDYYLDESRSAGAHFSSREAFDRIYELQTIQRCFKACGSFSSFYNMRNDLRYLKYISKTLTRVRQSLLQFKEYYDFLKILEDRGVFQKNFDAT